MLRIGTVYSVAGRCKGKATCRGAMHWNGMELSGMAWHCRGMEPRGDARVRNGKAVQIEARHSNGNVNGRDAWDKHCMGML